MHLDNRILASSKISICLLTSKHVQTIICNIKIARAIEERRIIVSPLKKGQKLTDNPKNVRLDLRLTKSEAEDLQYCADKLNTSRTDVINRGVRKIKEELEKE